MTRLISAPLVHMGLALAFVFAMSFGAAAAPLELTPANPQPSGVKAGLNVSYSYPEDVKSLSEARAALKQRKERGAPLSGLDHRDTNEGDITMTSKRAQHVVAHITGYMKFDKAGVYDIEFLTNDGLQAKVGGQLVGHFDGRQTCDTTVMTEVNVPVAGWYPVDIVYFQRLGTACLHMRMGPSGGRVTWVKDAVFAR